MGVFPRTPRLATPHRLRPAVRRRLDITSSRVGLSAAESVIWPPAAGMSFLATAGQLCKELLNGLVMVVRRYDRAAVDSSRHCVLETGSFVFVGAITLRPRGRAAIGG